MSKQNSSFNDLVDAYGKQVYSLIFKMVLNREDAEDLTQNVFIKVYQKLDSFRGDSNIFSWIYRIAYNEAMDFHRVNKKSRTLKEEYVLSVKHGDISTFDEVKAWEKLHKAINTLPTRQAEVFIMRYLENLSYEDMAEKTQISVSALKTSYHLACKKIEQFLLNEIN